MQSIRTEPAQCKQDGTHVVFNIEAPATASDRLYQGYRVGSEIITSIVCRDLVGVYIDAYLLMLNHVQRTVAGCYAALRQIRIALIAIGQCRLLRNYSRSSYSFPVF